MGTDDIFKRKRADRKQRRHEFKIPKANSYLIVTEGKRTEPLYFKGLQKIILQKIGGSVEVVEAPVIEISGEGCSTGKLIEAADRIVKNAKIIYQNVWLVFDRDDFADFDKAINAGLDKGYKIAWSNPSFEYWLYLHFSYSDSALHRNEWMRKLNELFKVHQLGDGCYRKNDENIYNIVNTFGGVDIAINHAKRRMKDYDKNILKPSQYNPGTMVWLLVEELRKYLIE